MIKIKFPWWNGYKMSSLLFFIKTLLRSSEIFLPAWYETQWCKNFNFPDFSLTLKFLSLAIFWSVVTLVGQDQHYMARWKGKCSKLNDCPFQTKVLPVCLANRNEWIPAKSFQNEAISNGDSLPYFTKMIVVFFSFHHKKEKNFEGYTLPSPYEFMLKSTPGRFVQCKTMLVWLRSASVRWYRFL